MSGGSVWLYDNSTVPQEEIWSPLKRSKLIGVQSARNAAAKVLLIESTQRHRDWLLGAAAELDAYYAGRHDV